MDMKYGQTVKNIFTSANELVEQIYNDQQAQRKSHSTDLPMTFMQQTMTPIYSQVVSESSHQIFDSEFMWSQLLIEILLRMNLESIKIHFQELLSICRKQYGYNETNIKYITELETTYNANQAIWWYTRETFFQYILNCALRRQNIDLLVKFSFLIRDMNEQLKVKSNFNHSIVHLYRGQLMTIVEFDNLKMNIGKYVSMNSFLSTTKSCQVTLLYAGTDNVDLTKVSILFEIEVDTQAEDRRPFRDITEQTTIESEEEVLFMLGNIFKIHNIC
ncbi:unnamed protein product [Rotaria sordida]|uniref:Uncharacterized protein n=1 Tax=Rotaria sordida TaxID=392033 RepID=A0A815EM01_9BILA|nr:unnamed protein product [Rotaria sordida]CAF1581737.1 unnamed protein product [Rotaria sordida]